MEPSALLVAMSLLVAGFSVARAEESLAPHGAPGGQLGSVQFSVSCQEASQHRFNRAVALLHSFWYDEAEKAFRAIADTDPDCVMAHWGVAMSSYHPLWAPPSAADLAKGRAALEQARGVKATTDRERDYLEAIATFYHGSDTVDHRTRSLAFAKAMERVAAKYPGDKEAAMFYALALDGIALPSDKSYANQKKAGAILTPIFKNTQDHPGVAHYLIHSYDYPPLAEQGLPAARRYAQIAPSSPHALHMPSHIFTRLGLWEESIGSNQDSARAAKAGSAEELHAMDYLMYAYLQGGQDEKAKTLDRKARRMAATVDTESFAAAYALAAIPARYALERRDYALATGLIPAPTFPWARFRQYEAITHFARAIGHARTGKLTEAKKAVDQLAAIRQALVEKDAYWAEQVEIQRRAAAAELARAEGKPKEALALMQSAVELEAATEKHPVTPGAILPTRELLAELFIELKQPEQALKEYEASLAVSPNRFNAVYGAAKAARLAGNTATAAQYYRALASLAAGGDGTRAELKEARTFLQNAGAGSH